MVHFTATGTCVIDANQAGNANYNAAPQVKQSIAIGLTPQSITYTSTAPTTAVVGGATYTPTATATSGLAVTITVDSSSSAVCTITGGVVSFQAAGSCVLDANQAGNGTYAAAPQIQQTFTVGKANQAITFTSTAPTSAVVGGATYTPAATGGASGNPVTITVDGTSSSVCSITAGVVSFQTAGTCTLDANQAGNTNYNAAPQVQQGFAVGKGSQTVSFTSTAPTGAVVAGATYSPTATATSGLAVTITVDGSSSSVCSITGGAVSFATGGTCTLDANQAGNANYTAATQVQQSFTVAKATQTVTFTTTAPTSPTIGNTYTPAASASSGLTPAITLDGTSTGCTIAAGVVTFTATGTCVIDANQAGNASYLAAAQVQQSVAIGKTAQSISFTSTAPTTAVVGGATYTPTATATSGLAVTFTIDASSTAICSLSAGKVSFNEFGTCVIDANQAGNATYAAAPQVTQSVSVGQGSQAITFTSTAPTGAVVGGATYSPTATGGASGNPVVLSIDATTSSVCSITGGAVSFPTAGTCTVDANQAGNANYSAAPLAQQSFTVGKGSQTVSFTSTAPTGAVVAGATYSPTATATSGLAVTITVDGSSSSVCSITGGAVSFATGGTCTLDANQAGNANYTAATQVQQSFTVAKASQTVTFTTTAPTSPTIGNTYTPAASASSGLTPAITLDATSTGCTIAAGVVTFTATGTCVIDANQAGNASYNAAAQVQQSVAIGKTAQSISFTSTAPTTAVVGRGHLHAHGHGHLGPGGDLHHRRLVDRHLLAVGRQGQLQRVRHLCHRRQPGRERHLRGGPAGHPERVGGPGLPGHHLHLDGAHRCGGRRGHLLADGHRWGLGQPGGALHRRHDLQRVLHHRRGGQLRHRRDLHRRRQPGRERQLHGGAAGPAELRGGPRLPDRQLHLDGAHRRRPRWPDLHPGGIRRSFGQPGGHHRRCLGLGDLLDQLRRCQLHRCRELRARRQPGREQQLHRRHPGPAELHGGQGFPDGDLHHHGPDQCHHRRRHLHPGGTASSGLTPAITLDGTSTGCSLSAGVVTFTATGVCVLDANQSGNANYNAASQVQQLISVGKAAQSVSFTSTAPSNAVVGGASYIVTASATSGLTPAFTIDAGASAVCTISGPVVSFTAVGSCVIDANQAGNASYAPAPQVQQTFTVGQGSQAITFTSTAPTTAVVGGATYTPTATGGSSGNPVVLSIDATTSSVCSISGGAVSFATAGTCTVDANQAGNTNYTAAPLAQQSFVVGPGSQTVSFTSTAPTTAVVGGATYSPTATSTSGLAVTVTVDASSSSVCAITAGAVSFQTAGTCTLDANQSGNANYTAAAQVQQSFTVGKGSQTVTFTSTAPTGVTIGVDALHADGHGHLGPRRVTFTIDASSSSVCTISAGAVSFTASGSCVIDANQAGNANYTAAPQVQQSVSVSQVSQSISFTSTAPSTAVVGGATDRPRPRPPRAWR